MHIVFQQEDVKTLSKSFELDESLKKDIIEIKDDYAVGPLENIYSEEGIENRKEWWRKVLTNGDLDGSVDSGVVNDQKAVEHIKKHLDNNENEDAWIWVAANKHDVCGYYWLMTQLKDYAGRVYVLHLNNLPFINEKGSIFYPENLHEILPKEFLKAKKLARIITASEFELDPDEWEKICQSGKYVRILEGAKKLSLHNVDFFDKHVLEFITNNWQKANKVIHTFLSKSKQVTGDAFILWRLKQLIEAGKIEAQGVIKNMKDFEVKKIGENS
jgi:hypothetical protein